MWKKQGLRMWKTDYFKKSIFHMRKITKFGIRMQENDSKDGDLGGGGWGWILNCRIICLVASGKRHVWKF